ncbi:uncharacterized protein LOC128996651 [Macrosteles quadrilineatus]|uniref:uncharacterized protein LOC128996651 n=1 Tax=Macrosteles quadrilineatus TaxID=74068 RepID=UPI0023E1D053|nr:uncharacterized protein LOC128996651 [Macrosteles quadrilineatus]
MPLAHFYSLLTHLDNSEGLRSDNLDNLLQHVFKKFVKNNERVALAGDLNVDFLNLESSETEVFLNLLRSFNLYCTNHSPTRLTAGLDNIYTNLTPDYYEVSLVDQDISDHTGVWLKLNLHHDVPAPKEDTPMRKRRLMNETTWTIASHHDLFI